MIDPSQAKTVPGETRALRPWMAPLLLVLALVVALGPSLQGEFIWDDEHQIVDAPQIRSIAHIPTYFRATVHEGVGAEYVSSSAPRGMELYRPLFVTLLAVEYALAGGADPLMFRALALLLHALAVLLVWAVARRWLGSEPGAFAAAWLFAFHPVTAEAYLFVSAQCDVQAVIGLLAAVLILEYARGSAAIRWAGAAAAALLLLAGLLSKETMLLALPPVCLWMWLGRGVPWRSMIPLAASAILFLALRSSALGGLSAGGGDADQRLLALSHLPVLLADGLRALLSMHPVGYRELALEYVRLGWPWAMGSVLLLAAAGATAWLTRRTAPVVGLALGVFTLVVAPVALVSTIPSWGGFGRYLYLPWAFGCMALAQAASAVYVKGSARRAGRIGAVALGALFLLWQGWGVLRATAAYTTPAGLTRSALLAAPAAGTGYVLQGNDCFWAEDLPCAADSYGRAVALNPELHYVRQNLAMALIYSGRAQEGLDVVLQLEAEEGRGPRSSFAVALALAQLGRADEAQQRLQWALQRAPDDPDLLWLRGRLVQAPEPADPPEPP